MKLLYLFLTLSLICCKQVSNNEQVNPVDSLTHKPDTIIVPQAEVVPAASPKVYANARFKEVTAEKTGKDQYLIKGKGQIFEANFGWVIEDGHNELQKGHQMTDAGAPEWENFEFSVKVQKERENSVLHLILFEASAMDGRRQHELPIVLE